jgi:dimethylaniline monooxygenase (N-oxide forming)
LRLPEDEPDFITPARYCQYFEDYVAKFGLEPYIHLKHRILSLRRHEDVKGHTLTILPTDGTSFTWTCDAVAICSGLHSNPEVPAIPGMEKVDTILHSSELKTRQQFGKDKSVMVLGAGETGMDICHLAITSPTKSVVLCHRNGFFCGPKVGVSLLVKMNKFSDWPYPDHSSSHRNEWYLLQTGSRLQEQASRHVSGESL